MARRWFIATAVVAAAALAVACGGGASKDKMATPAGTSTSAGAATRMATGSASGSPAASPALTGAPATSAATSPAPTSAPAGGGTPPSGGGGPTADAAKAQTLLQAAMITPTDLPAGWKVGSDATQDNAAAATADPTTAASNERCGRLLGRTMVTQPADIVSAYIGGQTVSFFSNATVYATTAGASDCAAEAATRLARPGQLARAFGPLFTDPDKVVVAPVDYPQLADGSFAATLSGQTNASGVVVDLVLLVVGFRKGNVSVVLGSAAQAAPPASELQPLVDKVLGRIAAAQ